MADLMPCPFCGNTDDLLMVRRLENGATFVRCDKCEAEGPVHDTDEEALDGWNTRTSEAPRG